MLWLRHLLSSALKAVANGSAVAHEPATVHEPPQVKEKGSFLSFNFRKFGNVNFENEY